MRNIQDNICPKFAVFEFILDRVLEPPDQQELNLQEMPGSLFQPDKQEIGECVNLQEWSIQINLLI